MTDNHQTGSMWFGLTDENEIKVFFGVHENDETTFNLSDELIDWMDYVKDEQEPIYVDALRRLADLLESRIKNRE